MKSLEKILINVDEKYIDEVFDILINKTDYEDQVWFNQRQSIWLNQIRITKKENNYCYKIYIIIVEMLDNDWFYDYLMKDESQFVKDNFLLLTRKHLDYYITGLKLLDGGQYTKDDNNNERHLINFVSFIIGIYVKM